MEIEATIDAKMVEISKAELKRYRQIETAAQVIYADLLLHIERAPKSSVPVFSGIAELHDALNR